MISKWTILTNRAVNIIGFLAVVVASGSGLAMALGPSGERNEEMPGFLGLSRESWVELHEPAAVIFTLAILLHLIFHWRELRARCSQYLRKPRLLFNQHSVLILAIIIVMLSSMASE